MTGVLAGVRVLELASYAFVPSAGAVLADWGADVIKVEHPERGDPMRGLTLDAAVAAGDSNYVVEQTNRGKRSIGLDVSVAAGREVLDRLIETTDVFLTNIRAPARAKLGIDVDDIRQVKENVIYVRGTGFGVRGPDADRAGFDGTAYWSRTGFLHGLAPRGGELPHAPRGSGDLAAGQTLAGGVAAALFHRERTGQATVVDVSLMSTGMWAMSVNIASATNNQVTDINRPMRQDSVNPLTLAYRTADDGYVKLSMQQSDRFWDDLCVRLGIEDVAADPRFRTGELRDANSAACVDVLDGAFAALTLAEATNRLATSDGAWCPVQSAYDVAIDEQSLKNGYVVPTSGDGPARVLVSSPVQFDESVPELRPAPAHGADTDELLLELGHDWDEIIDLKISGSVL